MTYDEEVSAETKKLAPVGPYDSHVEHVRWHRNGIGGVGFLLVHFTFRDDNYKRGDRFLEAIGWTYASTDPDSQDGNAYYGVVVPSAPDRAFRGDHWADWLLDVLRAHNKGQDAYMERQQARAAKRIACLATLCKECREIQRIYGGWPTTEFCNKCRAKPAPTEHAS